VLPRIPYISAERRLPALGLGYGLFCLLYLGAFHLRLRAPTVLAPSAIDEAIPFLPATIWIYTSHFGLLFTALWCCRDEDRGETLAAMLLAAALGALTFLCFPTELARQNPPVEGFQGALWALIYGTDVPGNCLPSLHAALAGLAGRALWHRGAAWRIAGPLWAALVLASTLTTKQHIVLDAVAGLALVPLVLILLGRLERQLAPTKP